MIKGKHSSQHGHRLQKMPPDDSSGSVRRYTVRNSKYVDDRIHDSDYSNHDEPNTKTTCSNEIDENTLTSSLNDIQYPVVQPTSININNNGNREERLPKPAEDESLPRKSRSRTPSPEKKLQSFATRTKTGEEVQMVCTTGTPIDSDSSSRDASRRTAVADSKPSVSNDNSRSQPNDRDRALPPNSTAGRTHDPAQIAARAAYVERTSTRGTLQEAQRTEPKPTVSQKLARAFYGTTSTPSEPKQQYISVRELDDLRTAVGSMRAQLKDSEAQIKDQNFKIKELQYSLAIAEEARDDIIRKQQEENFKQLNTGRWLPQEESKIKGDLDRLKRSMKTWSKDCSIASMAPLQNLMEGTAEELALIQYLSNVVRLDEGRYLPTGLNTSKTPSLLLNALVAHDVYKTIFENPFFFLRDHLDYKPPRLPPDEKFSTIYQSMLANGREAHIWRSQTLRLLYPPLRESSTSAEISLHSSTDAQIARVSDWHAEHFIDGPARHLIHSDSEGQYIQRVKGIYKEAAGLSYQLWARRTAIKCITLRDMEAHATFALDNPYIEPHTLVRYDDHPDHLFGRPFTVVVHPIVEAFGTDEGDGYDQNGRVWAKAVVWLDSRVDSRRPQ